MTAALADEYAEVDGITYTLSTRPSDTHPGANQASVVRKGYPSTPATGTEYTGTVIIPETFTYSGTEYVVTTIGYEAFYQQTELTGVEFPSTITTIDTRALASLSLTSVTLPANVIKINMQAFFGAKNLTSVICLSPYPATLAANAFQGFNLAACKLYVPKGAVDRYSNVTGWGGFGEILEDPNSVITPTSVEIFPSSYEAFVGSTLQLTATIFPADATDKTVEWKSLTPEVATIDTEGRVTFLKQGLCNIEAICNGDRKVSDIADFHAFDEFQEIDGLSYQVELRQHTARVLGFAAGHEWTRLVIPASYQNIRNYTVTGIGEKAFAGTSIETLELPSSITEIGDEAFARCENLHGADLSDKVESIGKSAFAGSVQLYYLRCMNETAPVVMDNDLGCFDDATYAECALVVPAEYAVRYTRNPVWKQFTTRYDWSPTDIMPVTLNFAEEVTGGNVNDNITLSPVLTPSTSTFREVTLVADDPELVTITKERDTAGNCIFTLKLLKTGSTKLHYYCGMLTIECELNISSSGIEAIDGNNEGAVRYFNLQGVEVARPAQGQVVIAVYPDGRSARILFSR